MNFYRDVLLPGLIITALSGPGMECASYASTSEKRHEESYDISEAMRDFEYISKEQARKILRDNGVDGMDILEYMTAFPWTDELMEICEDFGADKEKVPLYQAMVFAESSGKTTAYSKIGCAQKPRSTQKLLGIGSKRIVIKVGKPIIYYPFKNDSLIILKGGHSHARCPRPP